MQPFEISHIVAVNIVQQVKIEIPRLRAPHGGLEDVADIFGRCIRPDRQFGRQLIGFARVAINQSFLDRQFGSPVAIDIGGVKIGEAGGHKGVDHLLDLRDVNRFVRELRQTHQAEPELRDLFPKILFLHIILLFPR